MRTTGLRYSLVAPLVLLWSPAARAEFAYPARYIVFQDSKAGYIDSTGQMVVQPRFRTGWEFSEGLAAVKVDNQVGFIDTTGKLVIPAQFDEFRDFSQGLAAVRHGGRWTFVNRDGKLGNESFDEVHSFSEGFASVRIGKNWGYVDRSLKLVIAPRFAGAWDYTEGLAPAKAGGKWGFIDTAGKFAIEPQYYWVDNFSEALAWVEGGPGKEGFVDRTGRLVIARRFWDAMPFSSGLAWVVLEAGSGYGLIDRTGKVVIEPRFDRVCPFSEGLASICLDYKWGYVDTAGKTAIELKFDFAGRFTGGLAVVAVENGRKQGWIDRTGRYVWQPNDPKRGEDTSSAPQRVRNAMYKSRFVGPAAIPAREVSVVGKPLRKRYPDGGKQVFSRNPWDMILYQDRIYIGNGDYWENTGPVEIYSFKPGQKDFLLEYTAPDEMVSKFYVFDDKLVIPGNDPQESWEFGNVYIKDHGEWHKQRTIPHGLHCFKMAYTDGTLMARVSTDHLPTLQSSKDWGRTWTPIVFDTLPVCLFTLDGKAQGINSDAGLCRFENGVFYSEQMVPRHNKLPGQMPRYAYLNRIYLLDDPQVFAGHVVGTSGVGSGIADGPHPLCVLPAGESEVALVEAFKDETVLDLYAQDDTLYLLGTRLKDGRYENAVYSTSDLRDFKCVATFTTDTFARSFVPVGGEFYVGLGSDQPDEKAPRPSLSTGDILRIIPAK